MAVFVPLKGGGLSLKKYQELDILADPAAEGMRNAEVRGAVSQLAKALKTAKGKVRASVPGNSVVTKFVKLPPIDSDDLSDLVTMEAQQQIPFPLDEGAWDWAALDTNGIEKEVVLVAIRQEILDDIGDSVAGAGLNLKHVAAAPTALFNAFRYNYPDVTEPVLLVDIGAKSTELIFIEGNKLFIQTLNSPGTTGASLTSAVAKEFGVSFAEAEAHKTGSGFVSLGSTEGLDEATAVLASFIRNSVNRLPGEITRRASFYRSQQGGNAPTKVYLAGGGANLGYLTDFLAEKLNLPIEPFNPLRRVKVADEAIANKAHQLGELVGLGVDGVGKAAFDIDLVPTCVGADRDRARRKPWFIGAACLLMAGTGIWAATKFLANQKAADKLAQAEETLAGLSGPAGDISSYNDALEDIELIGEHYAFYQKSRTTWIELTNEVRSYFASETVWITDLSPLVDYIPGDLDSGKPYFKGGIDKLGYGETAVDRRSGGPDSIFNAIRIEGIWRSGNDGKNHKAVNEVLARIRKGVLEDSIGAEGGEEKEQESVELKTFFNLTKKVEMGKKPELIELSEAEIFRSEVTLGEGVYGAQFTMILPLREPILFEQVTLGKSL